MSIHPALSAWRAPVDLYCERLGPEFWAEPVNALTNLAFLAAAGWGAVSARRRGDTSPAVWLLIALAAVIGVGSFLFHTFAQVWASVADTLPIWSFVALACAICAVRLGGWTVWQVVAGAAIIAAGVTTVTFLMPAAPPRTGPPPLNGSLQYAPAVLALAAFLALALWRRSPLARWIGAALAVFMLSLTARSLDLAVCPAFPPGLHWLWHLLNGLLIGIVLQIVILARPAASRATG